MMSSGGGGGGGIVMKEVSSDDGGYVTGAGLLHSSNASVSGTLSGFLRVRSGRGGSGR
jgi:hypothetical protein